MKTFYLTLCFLVLSIFANVTQAHEGRPVYIEIKQHSSSNLSMKWKIPPVMRAGQEPTIQLDSPQCEIEAGQDSRGLIGQKHYRCQDKPALAVSINYPGENPALSSLIIVQRHSGEKMELFSGPELRSIAIPQEMSAQTVAAQYLIGGVEHILAGHDHLVFVLCLMIIAASTKRLLLAITGFTLAHSVTLGLASLNVLTVSVPMIEILIALSIAVLAAEIVSNKRDTFAWRYPMSSACAFGLLHGFGFASVLSDLGLPFDMKIPALIFFNIGVELGQIAFVLVVLMVSAALIRIPWLAQRRDSDIKLTAYAIGSLSLFWLIERSIQMIA